MPVIPVRDLCLPLTALDDRGLARLRTLPALERVYLDGTKITDAGLESLAAQPRIESVSANGTAVTPSGAAAFRAKRPRGTVAVGSLRNSPYFLTP